MKIINYAENDHAIDNALQLREEEGFIKVDRLQRQLRLGYQKAKQLIDIMEEKELVVPFDKIRWKNMNKKLMSDISK